jgi:integrase
VGAPVLEVTPPATARRTCKRIPFVPRQTHVDAMLAAAKRPKDRLLLEFDLFTGLRVAELCALEVLDVDLDQGQVIVRQGKGGKDRIVPLPARLIEPLRAWIGQRTAGPLFPSPRGVRLSTRAVQKLIKRLAAAAGLPEANKPRRFTPHKLRHRYATNLYKKSKNLRVVQTVLGHESIATTEIYTHVEDDDLKQAVVDL